MMFILQKKHPTTKRFKPPHLFQWFSISATHLGLLVIGFCWVLTSEAASLTSLENQVENLVAEGAVILSDESGNSLLSINPDRALIPASIVKILLAQAAYDILGREFRFKTEFYSDAQHSLFIKGWGDPFLVSEEILLIANSLAGRGLTRIRRLNLDHTAFSADVIIPGTSSTLNPYDALNGALVVNFNTLFIGRSTSGTIYSAESHTPLTPLALSKSKLIAAGSEERINLANVPMEGLEYAGQLFSAIFNLAGIPVADHLIGMQPVGHDVKIVYRHYSSKPLAFIFEGLMRYSNNFIANQVFLVMGAERLGYPASLEKSRMVMRDYLESTWGFSKDDMVFDEASGISRKNTLTARQMMLVLEHFKPNSDLLSERNGLKLKSGTLTGVYNYAGYIRTETGLRSFVIMTNSARNHRDRILKLLVKISDLSALEGIQP